MEIRRTTVEDLPRLLALYARARQFMADHGNPNQWGPTHWPPEALLRQDIAQGKSYVCLEAGRVVGTFFFTQGKDVEPTYRRIEAGAWRDDSPYGVVHRLASDGSVPGTGRFCLRWAYAQCGHLRIDTSGTTGSCRPCWRKRAFSPAAPFTWRRTPTPGWPMKRASRSPPGSRGRKAMPRSKNTSVDP